MSDSDVPRFRADGILRDGLDPTMRGVYPPEDSVVRPLIAAVHEYDLAHVVALERASSLPGDIAAQLLRTLLAVDDDPVTARTRAGGQVHSGENIVGAVLSPEVAGWLPLARSSSDLWTVSTRIALRTAVAESLETVLTVQRVLLDLADEHRESYMVGVTHHQHAQPTTLAHHILSIAAEQSRGIRRLIECLARVDTSTAGSAVLTGSSFALDTAELARLLGFSQPFDNSRDAAFGMDYLTEAVASLALVANLWSRWSSDLLEWSATEFGYVDFADRFCTTSSILPQKKNPVFLEYIRGVAAELAGATTQFLAGTSTSADSVIVDRELLIGRMWHLQQRFQRAGAVLAEGLRTARFDTGRMAERYAESWAFASDLAALLVTEARIAWRPAHALVARVVERCMAWRCWPEELPSAELSQVVDDLVRPELLLECVAEARTVASAVGRRVVAGGPASSDTARQSGKFRSEAAAAASELEEARDRWRQAHAYLRHRAGAILEATAQVTPFELHHVAVAGDGSVDERRFR